MGTWIIQSLESSFSVVSKPIFRDKYSCSSVQRNLQYLHIFAPLQTQSVQCSYLSAYSLRISELLEEYFKFHQFHQRGHPRGAPKVRNYFRNFAFWAAGGTARRGRGRYRGRRAPIVAFPRTPTRRNGRGRRRLDPDACRFSSKCSWMLSATITSIQKISRNNLVDVI